MFNQILPDHLRPTMVLRWRILIILDRVQSFEFFHQIICEFLKYVHRFFNCFVICRQLAHFFIKISNVSHKMNKAEHAYRACSRGWIVQPVFACGPKLRQIICKSRPLKSPVDWWYFSVTFTSNLQSNLQPTKVLKNEIMPSIVSFSIEKVRLKLSRISSTVSR